MYGYKVMTLIFLLILQPGNFEREIPRRGRTQIVVDKPEDKKGGRRVRTIKIGDPGVQEYLKNS